MTFQRYQLVPADSLNAILEDMAYTKAMAEANDALVEGLEATIAGYESTLEGLATAAATAAVQGRGFFWKGAWATATSYVVDDAARRNGSSYVCIQAHTSDASSEPGVGGNWGDYWQLMAAKGDAGAGTGDMLAANNLNDVADKAEARTNLQVPHTSHTHDDRYYTETEADTLLAAKAPTSRNVSAGTGLTGGGNLSADRTIAADIASQVEAENGSATNKLMTPERSRQHGDARYALRTRSISAGSGIVGGGDLSADRSFALNYPSQAEAEAGTDNIKPMTALRTAQAITALGGAAASVQTFDTSDTWTKPSKGTMALIEAWGGGGSGARHTTSGVPTGGGGGGYNFVFIPLSLLGSTENVVVGSGGAARSGSNQDGASGGNSSFGSWITAYGGAGGNMSTGYVSYGGSPLAAGISTASFPNAGSGMFPTDFSTPAFSLDGWFNGGGSKQTNAGGSSLYGGGGGGAHGRDGGTSKFGGDGGAGAANGSAGAAPGGGGGAGTSTSGAGGNGRVRVTIF